jgi:hypothetical protein
MKKELKVGNIIRIPGNRDYEFWACIMIEEAVEHKWKLIYPSVLQVFASSILWYEDPDGKPYEKGECPFDLIPDTVELVHNIFSIRFPILDISLASEPPPKQSHQKQNRTHAHEDELVEFKFAEIPK